MMLFMDVGTQLMMKRSLWKERDDQGARVVGAAIV